MVDVAELRHRERLRLRLPPGLDERGRTWTTLGDRLDGNSDGWHQVTRDLTAYAGARTKVRVVYATDGGVVGAGVVADDLSVTAGGATVFSDDVETADPAWTASKFVRTQDVPLPSAGRGARQAEAPGGLPGADVLGAGTPDPRTSAAGGHRVPRKAETRAAQGRAGGRSSMHLRNFPCWVMGHTYLHKPGDKDMLVCRRCGHQELVVIRQMRQGGAPLGPRSWKE